MNAAVAARQVSVTLGDTRAVDGASFTDIARDETSFSVSIVSYSQDHTTITDRRVGDLVNVETDILARYVDAAVARLTRGEDRQ